MVGTLLTDGSHGEGGGQILRTSLSLSLVTGRPFCIENIRGGRKRSPLGRQHLTAVRAVDSVADARLDGATSNRRHSGPLLGGFVPAAIT